MAADPQDQTTPQRIRVVIHSFFIIPFLIAVFAVLVFAMIKLVVGSPPNLEQALTTISRGSETERWQAAMDLTAMLQSQRDLEVGRAFREQLIFEYERSLFERKPYLRTYLALAMGLVGDPAFDPYLIESLDTQDQASRLAAIKALGLTGSDAGVAALVALLQDPEPAIVLESIISLGRLERPEMVPVLLPFLEHSEANMRWDAAIALAKLGDRSGWPIINNLLSRSYYSQFSQVNELEQDRAISVAIAIARQWPDEFFKENLEMLSRNDPNLRIADAALKALRDFKQAGL